jgi:hypothetical protein
MTERIPQATAGPHSSAAAEPQKVQCSCSEAPLGPGTRLRRGRSSLRACVSSSVPFQYALRAPQSRAPRRRRQARARPEAPAARRASGRARSRNARPESHFSRETTSRRGAARRAWCGSGRPQPGMTSRNGCTDTTRQRTTGAYSPLMERIGEATVRFIAGFGPIVRDAEASRRLYRQILGIPFARSAPDSRARAPSRCGRWRRPVPCPSDPRWSTKSWSSGSFPRAGRCIWPDR